MRLKGLAIKNGISLFALILLVTGCGSKMATSNMGVSSTPFVESTASPTTSPIASPSPSPQEIVTTMDFVNLNTADNRQVTLQLPDKWTATKEMYTFVDSFSYIQDKNKGIRSGPSYTIFDDMKTEIGHYYQIGYYPDQPNGASLPNHCDRPSPAYTGETKLGKGQIYVMNCDLPKEQRTDKYQTFDQIYAVIPIEGETNAYNFSFSVPLGESADRYLKIMKDILTGNDVGSAQHMAMAEPPLQALQPDVMASLQVVGGHPGVTGSPLYLSTNTAGEALILKVITWINTSKPTSGQTDYGKHGYPTIVKLNTKDGNMIIVEPAYNCVSQTNTDGSGSKTCTPVIGEIVLSKDSKSIRLISPEMYEWLQEGWKKEVRYSN